MVKGHGIQLSGSVEDLQRILGSPVLSASSPSFFSEMTWDNRQNPSDLFVAIRGTAFDGVDSIPQMIQSGVLGIVSETKPPQGTPENLTWWHVENSREAFAHLVQHAFRDPGKDQQVFGITGTNGKSSTVRMLASILEVSGCNTGWITTVDQKVAGESSESSCTTPSADVLASSLRRHVDDGGRSMVLEISSHAIHQHRTTGIPLVSAAVTQLGRDHLDYHQTVTEYHQVKKSLQHQVKAGGFFLLPTDPLEKTEDVAFVDVFSQGRWGGKIIERTSRGIRASLHGPRLELELDFPRPAIHDLSNALCAAILAISAGASTEEIRQGLEISRPVPGRLEEVAEGIFVDYAHTPDALEAVLKASREFCSGDLRVVFGCGGDRDRGKRPEMGRIAARHADEVYLTDDNPRSESSTQILQQIRGGMGSHPRVIESTNRRDAIAAAIHQHQTDDILIIAGKGHETTQEIQGELTPFDDRQVVRDILGVVT